MRIFEVKFSVTEILNGEKTNNEHDVEVIVIIEDNETGIDAIIEAKKEIEDYEFVIEYDDEKKGSKSVFTYSEPNLIGLTLKAETGIQQ